MKVNSTPLYLLGIILFLFHISTPLFSQQLPVFTQYSQFNSFINPASISSEMLTYGYSGQVAGSYRNQWSNHKYSPRTAFIKGEYLTGTTNDFGLIVGGHVLSDEAGPNAFNGFYGRVAVLGGNLNSWGFAGGLNIGYIQQSINTQDITFLEDGDAISALEINQGILDIGAGIYFYKYLGTDSEAPSIVYIGASVPQIGFDLSYRLGNEFFDINREIHYYGLAGFFKKFDDGSFFEISAWGKYLASVPFNIDGVMKYQFSVPFWVGIGGSSAKSAHFEAGVSIGQIIQSETDVRVSYSVDRFFNDVGPNFGTTHEVGISWLFGARVESSDSPVKN